MSSVCTVTARCSGEESESLYQGCGMSWMPKFQLKDSNTIGIPTQSIKSLGLLCSESFTGESHGFGCKK